MGVRDRFRRQILSQQGQVVSRAGGQGRPNGPSGFAYNRISTPTAMDQNSYNSDISLVVQASSPVADQSADTIDSGDLAILADPATSL